MDVLAVECLQCGERHTLLRGPMRQLRSGECPRCGYLGWAGPEELSERVRRVLRDRPLELRRVRAVV